MTDFPQMDPAELIAHADPLDLKIPRFSETEAMAKFNHAFALRARAQKLKEKTQ